MYKITNKSTGFIQYRNAEDAADFVHKNYPFTEKYTLKRIKEIDTEFIEEISYAVIGGICLSILLTLFYIVNL